MRAVEGPVLVRRVQAGEPGKPFVEGGPMNLGCAVHVIEPELSYLHGADLFARGADRQ